MTRSLTVPPDVADLIGAARAAEITAGPHPAEYRCTRCSVRGLVNEAEPLVAGLDLHPEGSMRLWIAHKRCSPGGVRRVAHLLAHPDESSVTGLLGALATPLFGALPFMLVEHLIYTATVDPGQPADGPTEVDLIMSGYARLGLEPCTGINTPAPPHKPGWRIVLPRRHPSRHANGGVYGPEGVTVMDQLPPVPDVWPGIAAEYGGVCNLFVASRIGLNEVARRGAPGEVLLEAVERAARAGRLMGITARVVFP